MLKARNILQLLEASGGIFVVQEHYAFRAGLHYDLRLSLEGKLKSWAIRKGPSMDPSQKRLAIPTPDHTKSWATFEGAIEKGELGAGWVSIWDKGSVKIIEDDSSGYKFELGGKTLKGQFKLQKMSGKNFLLIKTRDNYAQDGWHLEPKITKAEAYEKYEKAKTRYKGDISDYRG